MPDNSPNAFVEQARVIDVNVTVAQLFNGAIEFVNYVDDHGVRRRATFEIVPGHRLGGIVSTDCGNLSVRLNLEGGCRASVDGDDITTTVTINDLEAKYGTTFTLQTSWGKSPELVVDANTTDGATDEYGGFGLPNGDGTAGDLVITWEIVEAPTFDIDISAEELANGFERTFSVVDEGETRELEVSVAPGWRDGEELELRGECCYVRLNVAESGNWTIDGDNVYVEVWLSADELEDGCDITVNLPIGEEDLIIDPGTEDGEECSYSGLGLPGNAEYSQGDLILTVRMRAPAQRTVIYVTPKPIPVRTVVSSEQPAEPGFWRSLWREIFK